MTSKKKEVEVKESSEKDKSEVWEPKDRPKCPLCGEDVKKKGHETFASKPHKRKTYKCKECGHTFTPKPELDGKE